MIRCSNCGEVEKCPRCDISLTYHKSSNSLRCHYCNYTKKSPDVCSKCGSTDIKGIGLGTEKLEMEIKEKLVREKILKQMQHIIGKLVYQKNL